MRLFLAFAATTASAFLSCKTPRKYYRVGKNAVLECSEEDRLCKVQCEFGVQDGMPSEIMCNAETDKWNHAPKTKIFCNAEAQAVSTAAPTTITTTTTTTARTTTLCGNVSSKYLIPNDMSVSCTDTRCQLSCSEGKQAVPKLVKCFPKRSMPRQWAPRPFTKMMCIGRKPTKKPVTDAPSNALVMNIVGSQQSGNGFAVEDDRNTITDCGDMKKMKNIKLAFGVDFICESSGCTYSCHNPLSKPNIEKVSCVRKNKRKMELRPRRANIKCTQETDKTFFVQNLG